MAKKKPQKARRKNAVAFRKSLVTKSTKAERLFKKLLESAGLHFKFQKMINVGVGKYRFADFYLPRLNTIIEIDGGYHNAERQTILDSKREDEILKAKPGFKIIRFTNDDVIMGDPRAIVEKLIEIIRVRFNEAALPLPKGV